MLLRLRYRLCSIVLVCLILVASTVLILEKAKALEINNRYIDVGSSAPSVVTNHDFGFDFLSNTNVGSVKFEYCSNSPLFEDVCTVPVGLDVSGVSLDSETGETGFSIDASTNANTIVITRASVPANPGPSTYGFGNATNPSNATVSTFVRVSTYASVDATGPHTDRGAVVFSTTTGLAVGAYVPPYITFCVGITVSTNCSLSTGSFIDLGELSVSQARYASSQMAVSTNDPAGYVVGVHGTTMTSGNKTIPALTTPSYSTPGTSQFGINLRANSSPSIGSNPAGVGTGYVMANYNVPNRFYFVTDTNVAASTLPTEFTRFTVSYLVNISKSQPKGIYNTTNSFIAVAAF